MARLTAVRHTPILKAHDERLPAAGKRKNVALAACMRSCSRRSTPSPSTARCGTRRSITIDGQDGCSGRGNDPAGLAVSDHGTGRALSLSRIDHSGESAAIHGLLRPGSQLAASPARRIAQVVIVGQEVKTVPAARRSAFAVDVRRGESRQPEVRPRGPDSGPSHGEGQAVLRLGGDEGLHMPGGGGGAGREHRAGDPLDIARSCGSRQ
jgi:hypothetical protein